MNISDAIKFVLENNLQKEERSSIHRYLFRAIKKGNRFSILIFLVTYVGLSYYDALLWSYQLFTYLGFVVIRCIVAMLLFFPNLIRFPIHTNATFLSSYFGLIVIVWIFGAIDGIVNGPEDEKYEKPGLFYLFPLFIFGYTMCLVILDYFTNNDGLIKSISNSNYGFYPLISLFIGWPVATKIWYLMERNKTNKNSPHNKVE